MNAITDKLNAVIDYIEANLTKKIDTAHIARLTCCSYYDAGRLFSLVSNISISEYIRKRRLTLAGIELQSSNAGVLEIALKYQYDSPVSFARAFQQFHGFPPSYARNGEAVLSSFPRLVYQINVKEVLSTMQKGVIIVDGKSYEADYLGAQDMSGWSEYATKREYWRVKDMGEDFDEYLNTSEVLPYNNYPPVVIEVGQIFVIDYHKRDGNVDRRVYKADGTIWQGMESTRCIVKK